MTVQEITKAGRYFYASCGDCGWKNHWRSEQTAKEQTATHDCEAYREKIRRAGG